jgi:hypothetical protein
MSRMCRTFCVQVHFPHARQFYLSIYLPQNAIDEVSTPYYVKNIIYLLYPGLP